jgi:hypothetical protein
MPNNLEGYYDMGLFWLTVIGLAHLWVCWLDDRYARYKREQAEYVLECQEAWRKEKLRREAMGTKTIKIELRYNSESETDKVMRQVTRECARTLMASAMLVSSGRQPQIAVTCEDIFAADQTKIDLMMDELEENPPELEQVGEEA